MHFFLMIALALGLINIGCDNQTKGNYSAPSTASDQWLTTGQDIYYDNGNVGIGTTTPDEKLHVYTATGPVTAKIESAAAGNASLELVQGGGALWSITNNNIGNRLSFTAGGVGELFTIASSGNVGVGTSTPLYPLEISKADPANGYILNLRNSDAASYSGAWMRMESAYPGTGVWAVGIDDTGFALWDDTNSAVRFHVSGNGYTGIGTATPATTLHVAGANEGILIENTAGAVNQKKFSIAASGDALQFTSKNDNNTDRSTQIFNLTGSGNIGIGTISPTAGARLEIIGTGSGASSILIPRDTVANRPTTGVNGMIRYASDTNKFEAYENGAWTNLIGTASSVAASNGTVSAPSLSFSGDPNTGLYSSGADAIGFAAGGAQVFNLTSTSFASPTTGGALITSGNGTAAAPTFSFTGDDDTGWFRPAANTLAASTAGTERVRIGSTGNVGIGTTGPLTTLDVSGASTTGGRLTISNTNTGILSGDKLGSLEFYTYDTSGTVGIGSKIESVAEDAGAAYAIKLSSRDSSGNYGVMNLSSSGAVGFWDATPLSDTITIDSSSARSILMTRHPLNNTSGNNLTIQAGGTGPSSTDKVGGDLILSSGIATGNGGSDIVFTAVIANQGAGTTDRAPSEVMRIQNSSVGIGTASPNYKLDVNGTIRGFGITDSSDLRLKHDIQPLQNALDKILNLQGVTFYWKDSSIYQDHKQVGVIAQDVEKIYPELVETDSKGIKSVNYSHLVAPLIEAIKTLYNHLTLIASTQTKQAREISSKVDKSEVEILRDQIENLKKENAAIKAWVCARDPNAIFCK